MATAKLKFDLMETLVEDMDVFENLTGRDLFSVDWGEGYFLCMIASFEAFDC